MRRLERREHAAVQVHHELQQAKCTMSDLAKCLLTVLMPLPLLNIVLPVLPALPVQEVTVTSCVTSCCSEASCLFGPPVP